MYFFVPLSISICLFPSRCDYIHFLLLNPQILTALNLFLNCKSRWLNWKVNNLNIPSSQIHYLLSMFCFLDKKEQSFSDASNISPTGIEYSLRRLKKNDIK